MIDIKIGDCREKLKELPSHYFNTVITSPPYWGLRDYGTGEWTGGSKNCSHIAGKSRNDAEREFGTGETLNVQYRHVCKDCGAVRKDAQIGMEESPEEYVNQIVRVFREVWRVLRDDGTLWLNLGDSYSSGGRTSTTNQSVRGDADYGVTRPPVTHSVKPKDLVGIPWRVAFALQADGWYLRQDIIWHKPNPMPESVKDRCTKAHEYLFLLTKSEKYYYDSEAIKEEATGFDGRKQTKHLGSKKYDLNTFPHHQEHEKWIYDEDGNPIRNKRSVWSVPVKPYNEAHFAVFPTELIEPALLAGCPPKICSECGTPFTRNMVTKEVPNRESREGMVGVIPGRNAVSRMNSKDMKSLLKIDAGITKNCLCHTGTTAGRVLDPFGGSGTTALVADRHGRDATIIELNKKYVDIAQNRLEGDAPLFTEVRRQK
jgi:DNA modification methylase